MIAFVKSRIFSFFLALAFSMVLVSSRKDSYQINPDQENIPIIFYEGRRGPVVIAASVYQTDTLFVVKNDHRFTPAWLSLPYH